MTPNELPTSIEELRQFALDTLQQMKSAHDAKEKLQREVIIAKQQAIELTLKEKLLVRLYSTLKATRLTIQLKSLWASG